MAKVNYIVYSEPDSKRSGCDVKFFVREFDSETKKGKSHFFVKEMPLIIPSFEMPEDEATKLIGEYMQNYPNIEFKEKAFSMNKSVIWAYLKNKEEKVMLPKWKKIAPGKYPGFLTDKTSFSQQIRFYYPPFTIIEKENNEFVLPTKFEKSSADLETIINDKKCALDIETIDYDKPELERISNVVLNFKDKKYIVTTFVPSEKKFNGYEIVSIRKSSEETIDPKKSTDSIKKIVADIIQKEDPLILYGFNIQFDQKKLRELGDDKYLPGVNETKPVFKSVQGLPNIITKGRFTIDLYGYLFMYYNLYENNKLETHARMAGLNFKKGLDYDILARKTKKGEQGSVEDMMEVMKYVTGDGDVTYELGEKNIKKITLKSIYSKRDHSTICTTSGKSIMKEFWQRKYFLNKNTLNNRYERDIEYDPEKKKWMHKKDDFVLENYKDKLLNLEKNDGLFKDISLVYPLLFVKSLWPVIEGTTDNLRFTSPDECLDSYQTLNEFICNAIKDLKKFKEKYASDPKELWKFNHSIKEKYEKIDYSTIDMRLERYTKKFNELLEKSNLINYSKKFLYMRKPEEIIKENLGFIYGKGNCLCSGNKIVALLENKLIYQGFGLSKGKKTRFGIDLMREFLEKRLRFEDEDKIIGFLEEKIRDLRDYKIPREKLLLKDIRKSKEDPDLVSYGFINNKKVNIEEFIDSKEKYNPEEYIKNFLDSFEEVLYTGFENKEKLERVFYQN